MRRELFGFVFAHVDNCPACSNAHYCAEGKALIDRAVEIATECLLPTPIETPKAKA